MTTDNRRIIMPLDGMTIKVAKETAVKLAGRPGLWGFKGNDLIDQMGGVPMADMLRPYGKVFADPKVGDVKNTVQNRFAPYIQARASFVTIHATFGKAKIEAAVKACKGTETEPLVVTLLTDISPDDCKAMYKAEPAEVVGLFANWALECGARWVVCSTKELSIVKPLSLNAVVAAIRPKWHLKPDEQTDAGRNATPAEAIELGADLIVIGRPILNAPKDSGISQEEALQRTSDEIDEALKGK